MKHLKSILTILILAVAVAGVAEYAMAQKKQPIKVCNKCGQHYKGTHVCENQKPKSEPKRKSEPKPKPKSEPKKPEQNKPEHKEAEKQYVDLGLPSGTLWATMNIGANKPEDYGDYFAWGETTPKQNYGWSTYKWSNGSFDMLTKYCTKSDYGKVDNNTELDLADDAAYVNWGPEWRMPSCDQLKELSEECNWKRTKRNGVKGYLVTSKRNGASLFLPAAGYRYEGKLLTDNYGGHYWSRTLDSSAPYSAHYLYLYSGYVDWNHGGKSHRGNGQNVRAVRVTQN